MKVAYLTIEDISSGLFKTQILDIINEISIHDKSISFEIFILNRPWHYLKHKTYLNEYRLKYDSSKLNFIYIPLLPPLRNSLKYFFYSFIVTKWFTLIFNFFLKNNNYDIIHTRSYWPTISVIKSKIPILFDMRSLWILENISSGELKLNSKSYFYWNKIEIDCLRKATFSTCVSKSMMEYVMKICPISRTSLIPISVNDNVFRFNLEERINNRKKLNWDKNLIFVYSGSLGQSGINIKAISNLFKIILNTDNNYRLLIITSERHTYVKSIMNNLSVENYKYKIVHPKLNEIAGWLSSADIGLHALPTQLDSQTRLGTKVVEYWVNGLPVIVNKNVGAAAEYINKYRIGYVLDDSLIQDNLIDKITELSNFNRISISNFAKSEFSAINISSKYLQLYKYSINIKS